MIQWFNRLINQLISQLVSQSINQSSQSVHSRFKSLSTNTVTNVTQYSPQSGMSKPNNRSRLEIVPLFTYLLVLFLCYVSVDTSPPLSSVPRTYCDECDKPNLPYNNYCVSCGHQLPRIRVYCHACHTLNSQKNKFCMHCGVEVTPRGKELLFIKSRNCYSSPSRGTTTLHQVEELPLFINPRNYFCLLAGPPQDRLKFKRHTVIIRLL